MITIEKPKKNLNRIKEQTGYLDTNAWPISVSASEKMIDGCGVLEINLDKGSAWGPLSFDAGSSTKSSGKELTSFREADCHQGVQTGTEL